MSTTKNLIFDLGNVLYDIDFTKMYEAFDALGVPNFENHFIMMSLNYDQSNSNYE